MLQICKSLVMDLSYIVEMLGEVVDLSADGEDGIPR